MSVLASLGACAAVPLPLPLALASAITSRSDAPLENIVVLDSLPLSKTSEQLTKAFIVGEVAEFQTANVGIKYLEFRRETDSEQLLAFEFLLLDEVPGRGSIRALEFPPRQCAAHKINKHVRERL